MNTIAYFEIQADDLEETKKFYEALFGWKFMKAEGMPVEYFRIETDGIRGGLLKRPAPQPPQQTGTNAFTCSIEVSDFDTTAAHILNMKGKVAFPKFAVPNTCWQGYFIDPAGNTFGIFQVDLNAQ